MCVYVCVCVMLAYQSAIDPRNISRSFLLHQSIQHSTSANVWEGKEGEGREGGREGGRVGGGENDEVLAANTCMWLL